MNTFMNALQTNNTVTANGATTHSTSDSKCLDLFFQIGSSRGKDLSNVFLKAFYENAELAVRIVLWARDIRGGSGERDTFRKLARVIFNHADFDLYNKKKLVEITSELGRWDDVIHITRGTQLWDYAISMVGYELINNKNGLCAKWLPRKGKLAAEIRKSIEWSPKFYRKTIVTLSNTVEQKMCANQWDDIEFGKLPSIASARYQKAFTRHCGDAYGEYIEGLKKGTQKINAGAIYPHDIVKSLAKGNSDVADEQWKALPNYMEGSDERRILPVIDTSGSMYVGVGGNYGGETMCLHVAIALGLYLSERNVGSFKDYFITFSENPQLQHTVGTLQERVKQVRSCKWGYNTDLESVFKIIFAQAVKNRVPQEEMPTDILILSDMEFDQACYRGLTNYDSIRKAYEVTGYKLPNIIFWNLNAREGNSPVKADNKGTALVSGFSPAIMKSILANESVSPMKIMLETVMKERYNIF